MEVGRGIEGVVREPRFVSLPTHLPINKPAVRKLFQEGLQHKANKEIESIPKINKNEEGPVLENGETSRKEVEKDGDKDTM